MTSDTPATSGTPRATVLLVEDNSADAELAEWAMGRWKVKPHVVWVETAQGAIDYLRDAEVPPDLLLLDLSLPGASGMAVLTAIKTLPRLRYLPVVVLSAGSQESLIEAVASRADFYIEKSGDVEKTRLEIARLEDLTHPGRGLRVIP